jgi:pyruvate/2-oxoglutarate dehydrogenase complex dihydrolipoamide dehydrogenase (E3) component
MSSYDAIVIGTGQAGKPLAKRLAESGRKTAIVERAERVGGSCIVDGCTPTKTMVASGRVAYLARRASDYGVATGEVAVDLEKVRERKRAMVEDFSGGARRGLEEQENLDLIFGEARCVSRLETEESFASARLWSSSIPAPGRRFPPSPDSTRFPT